MFSYISGHTENNTSRTLAYNLLTTDNIFKMYSNKWSGKISLKVNCEEVLRKKFSRKMVKILTVITAATLLLTEYRH